MDKDNIKKSYYAIIPADVRYHKGFKGGDPRLLYGEITALCNDRGYCWASNKYFADLYQVDNRTVRRWVSQLEKLGFIYSEVKGVSRKIFLSKQADFNTDGLSEDQPKPKKKATTKKKKTTTKKVSVKFIEEDIFLAELLLQKIIYNFPAFENRKVSIPEWADDIRKLREIDKATAEQIRFMIIWIHGGDVEIPGKPLRVFEPNEFWSKNIMSAKKLRKQWFDHLVPQLQTAFKKEVKKTQKETVTKM